MLVSSPASARKMNLQQLLEMARSNPGLQASAAATSAMEAQVMEAKLNWLPQGDILSLLAPSPDIQCNPPPLGSGVPPPCLTTSAPEASLRNVSWNKVFTRTELKLIQPLYDFGKISAGVAAAEAGVNVARQREAGARADLELNIRKAYYGLKFAREVIDMLEQGSSYVDEGAQKLEKDLAERHRQRDGHRQAADAHRARRAGRSHPGGEAAAKPRAREPAHAARPRRPGRRGHRR